MGIKNLPPGYWVICFWIAFGLTACQTSNAPADTADSEATEQQGLAPQRVDVRGSIIRNRYNQGQVVLEVEGTPSQYTRFYRAYVLVLPTTQIIGPDGKTLSLSELRIGQNVAIFLRGGGRGTLDGIGTARKVWVEERF